VCTLHTQFFFLKLCFPCSAAVLCCQGLPSLALWPRSALTCGPVLPAPPTASSKQQHTPGTVGTALLLQSAAAVTSSAPRAVCTLDAAHVFHCGVSGPRVGRRLCHIFFLLSTRETVQHPLQYLLVLCASFVVTIFYYCVLLSPNAQGMIILHL
jgi:hypothetical protein